MPQCVLFDGPTCVYVSSWNSIGVPLHSGAPIDFVSTLSTLLVRHWSHGLNTAEQKKQALNGRHSDPLNKLETLISIMHNGKKRELQLAYVRILVNVLKRPSLEYRPETLKLASFN